METNDKKQLELYESMDDKKLIALYKSGGLTNSSKITVEAILAKRNISFSSEKKIREVMAIKEKASASYGSSVVMLLLYLSTFIQVYPEKDELTHIQGVITESRIIKGTLLTKSVEYLGYLFSDSNMYYRDMTMYNLLSVKSHDETYQLRIKKYSKPYKTGSNIDALVSGEIFSSYYAVWSLTIDDKSILSYQKTLGKKQAYQSDWVRYPLIGLMLFTLLHAIAMSYQFRKQERDNS